MLAKGGVDDAHVKQNLGGVGNLLEIAQCLIELIIVVPRERGNPCFYFLYQLLVVIRIPCCWGKGHTLVLATLLLN